MELRSDDQRILSINTKDHSREASPGGNLSSAMRSNPDPESASAARSWSNDGSNLKHLTSEMKSIEEFREEVKTKDFQIFTLQAELEKMRTERSVQLEELVNKNKMKAQELSTLQQESKMTEENLEADLQDLNDKFKFIADNSKKAEENCRKLKEDNERLRKRTNILFDEIDSLKEKLKSKEKELESNKDSLEKKGDIQKKITKELEKTLNQINETGNLNKKLKEKLTERENTFKRLVKKNRELSREIEKRFQPTEPEVSENMMTLKDEHENLRRSLNNLNYQFQLENERLSRSKEDENFQLNKLLETKTIEHSKKLKEITNDKNFFKSMYMNQASKIKEMENEPECQTRGQDLKEILEDLQMMCTEDKQMCTAVKQVKSSKQPGEKAKQLPLPEFTPMESCHILNDLLNQNKTETGTETKQRKKLGPKAKQLPAPVILSMASDDLGSALDELFNQKKTDTGTEVEQRKPRNKLEPKSKQQTVPFTPLIASDDLKSALDEVFNEPEPVGPLSTISEEIITPGAAKTQEFLSSDHLNSLVSNNMNMNLPFQSAPAHEPGPEYNQTNTWTTYSRDTVIIPKQGGKAYLGQHSTQSWISEAPGLEIIIFITAL